MILAPIASSDEPGVGDLITEIRCVASGDFIPAAAVALHSFLTHNPWFTGSCVICCGPGEAGDVASLLSFLPRLSVFEVSGSFADLIDTALAERTVVRERFWGLELLARPADSGDVLLLDADTCTLGSFEALARRPEPVVACAEGAGHRGDGVDRSTNAFQASPGPEVISRTFNSGVVRFRADVVGPALLDDCLDVIESTDWSIITRLQHDQLVLNRVFERRWVEASPEFNFLMRHADLISERTDIGLGDARLVHFNAAPRPWHLGEPAPNARSAAATIQWHRAYTRMLQDRAASDALPHTVRERGAT